MARIPILFSGILICFMMINAVTASPYEVVESHDSSLNRTSRQMQKFNPDVTSAIVIAIGMMLCTNDERDRTDNVCNINVKELGIDHALLIDPTHHKKFFYPNAQGNIQLKEGEKIFLSCPGENNKLKNVAGTPKSETFTCVCDQAFKANNAVYNFKNLNCDAPPQYSITSNGIFGKDGEIRKFEIGFDVDSDNFLRIIRVEYDRVHFASNWAMSEISKSIAGAQKTAKNRRFDQKFCCEQSGINLDNEYKIENQESSFARQLVCHNSEENKCKYFDASKGLVLNRGHLAPKSTFVYTAAGVASFVYLNTLPQWKLINDGNWARIEDYVVEMAKSLEKDLTVYTGGWDILELKDTADDNKMKEIYLYNQNDAQRFPVPKYTWKIVYDYESNKGIMFVTSNNPYFERSNEDLDLCKNPLRYISGAKLPKWKASHSSSGYSYICQLADFALHNSITRETFDFPIYTVTELLYIESTLTPRDELKRQIDLQNE